MVWVSAVKNVKTADFAHACSCAIYSPHTALDAAPNGTNDVLAQQLGLQQVANRCR